MAAPALIFDADGTLWDSYPWYAEVLAGLSGRAPTELQRRLAAGESIVGLVRSCDVPDTRFCRACGAAANRLRLYAGVSETLATLKRRGTACAVVTNLPGRIVNPLLDGSGLASHFPVVVHAGTVRPGKPNPAPLREAARMMGLNGLVGVYYVGDSLSDAIAAERAGLRFAWAEYGYGAERPEGDAVVLRSFRQVLDL
jgi:HAD superfamily hydrolase (TIGR01509 family)